MGDIFESSEEVKLVNSACTIYVYCSYLLLWIFFCEFVFELLETVELLMVPEPNYSVNSVPGILLLWNELALHESIIFAVWMKYDIRGPSAG